MKEKLLELIHEEISHMKDDNIFKQVNGSTSEYYSVNPFRNFRVVESKDDESSDWNFHENVEYITGMDFTLVFEDGDPPISITTNITTHFERRVSNRKWFFKKEYKKYGVHKIETIVKCDKYSFILTKEEEEILTEKTKFAYQLYVLNLETKKEEMINEKLNMRLAKWKK